MRQSRTVKSSSLAGELDERLIRTVRISSYLGVEDRWFSHSAVEAEVERKGVGVLGWRRNIV